MRAIAALLVSLSCSAPDLAHSPEVFLGGARVALSTRHCTGYDTWYATSASQQELVSLFEAEFPEARVETEVDSATGRTATSFLLEATPSRGAIGFAVFDARDAPPDVHARSGERAIVEVGHAWHESD